MVQAVGEGDGRNPYSVGTCTRAGSQMYRRHSRTTRRSSGHRLVRVLSTFGCETPTAPGPNPQRSVRRPLGNETAIHGEAPACVTPQSRQPAGAETCSRLVASVRPQPVAPLVCAELEHISARLLAKNLQTPPVDESSFPRIAGPSGPAGRDLLSKYAGLLIRLSAAGCAHPQS